MSMSSTPVPSTRKRRQGHVSRPRASYSCHCCRTKRVKCDRVHPVCSRCKRDEEICTYDGSSNSRMSGGTISSQVPSDIGESQILDQKVGSQSNKLNGNRDRPQLSQGTAVPGLGYLSLQKGGRSRYVGQTFWAYVGEDDNGIETLLQDQDRYHRPEADRSHSICISCLKVQDDTSSLPLPPFRQWSNYQQQISEVDYVTKAGVTSRVSKESGRYAHALPKLLEDLPSKKTSDMLYHSFVVSIHTLLPLLHLHTFDQEYHRFWEWVENDNRIGPPTGILVENPSFLPLLFAVLFGGSVTCKNEELQVQFNGIPRAVITSRLSEAALRTQNLVAFPRNPTIYSLMSFLIVHNLLIREEEPLASCSYISVALRVAQAMGLHRDGIKFGIPPIETEIRRRIWWHIIHTDVMTSIPSALPPSCLSDTIYDTKMLQEFRDEHMSLLTSQQPGRPQMMEASESQPIYSKSMDDQILDVRLMVAVDRYSITSILRQILRRQFDTTPLTKDDFVRLKIDVDALDSRISARLEQLGHISEHRHTEASKPQHKQGIGVDKDFDELGFIEWAQLLLKLMVHKTYGVLYQPLVRDNRHPMWAEVRPDCILRAQSFIDTFLMMCTSTRFQPYHWMYPGLYQPLHAAAVLLSDLLQAPISPEAYRSRVLIDRLSTLISPNDGVVSEENGVLTQRNLSEGGREAWSLIRRLRRKAWEKMGLDPDMVWTEDSYQIPPIASPRSQLDPSNQALQMIAPVDVEAVFLESQKHNAELDEFATHSDYFSSYGSPDQLNWMEWDAALAGTFEIPNI